MSAYGRHKKFIFQRHDTLPLSMTPSLQHFMPPARVSLPAGYLRHPAPCNHVTHVIALIGNYLQLKAYPPSDHRSFIRVHQCLSVAKLPSLEPRDRQTFRLSQPLTASNSLLQALPSVSPRPFPASEPIPSHPRSSEPIRGLKKFSRAEEALQSKIKIHQPSAAPGHFAHQILIGRVKRGSTY